MTWKSKKCKNCKASSSYLFYNETCPYCSPEHFIYRVIHPEITPSFKEISKVKEYIKNYKINLNNEEIKNRILSILLFEKNNAQNEVVDYILEKIKYGHGKPKK